MLDALLNSPFLGLTLTAAAFKSKVIMYLYEDAAKSVKRRLFEGCDASKYSSVCSAFDETGIEIFGADFLAKYNDFER